MIGWGGSMIFGRGPELKSKGGPSLFFFSMKILPTKIFFLGLGGPGPLWAQRGSIPVTNTTFYKTSIFLPSPHFSRDAKHSY